MDERILQTSNAKNQSILDRHKKALRVVVSGGSTWLYSRESLMKSFGMGRAGRIG